LSAKKTALVVAIVVAGVLFFFFFAPVFYWTNLTPVPFASAPAYRSLSCATLGIFGDMYSPGGFGFVWGCVLPMNGPV
jgi:hypothetical protein